MCCLNGFVENVTFPNALRTIAAGVVVSIFLEETMRPSGLQFITVGVSSAVSWKCDVSECPADHRRWCCFQHFPGGGDAPEWPTDHHCWRYLNSFPENVTFPDALRTIAAGVVVNIFLEEMMLPSGL